MDLLNWFYFCKTVKIVEINYATLMMSVVLTAQYITSGLILGLRPANERQRYFVSNAVSHWLGASPESALSHHITWALCHPRLPWFGSLFRLTTKIIQKPCIIVPLWFPSQRDRLVMQMAFPWYDIYGMEIIQLLLKSILICKNLFPKVKTVFTIQKRFHWTKTDLCSLNMLITR